MMSLEEMVETAKREMEQAEQDNDGLLILETADVCIDKLLAEVARLQAEVESLRAALWIMRKGR